MKSAKKFRARYELELIDGELVQMLMPQERILWLYWKNMAVTYNPKYIVQDFLDKHSLKCTGLVGSFHGFYE